MNEPFTRRYQIWDVAPQAAVARKTRSERFGLPDLLYADVGGLVRSPGEADDAAASLYRYGLPVEIELSGLCTLSNGRSGACRTRKISSESADFIYAGGIGAFRFKLPGEMTAGAAMHLDLDHIGKFQGALTAQNSDGFQIAVGADWKDMLSIKLARLATAMRSTNLGDPLVPAKLRVTRLELDKKSCCFVDHTGLLRKGNVINVSQIDALIKASTIPPVGSRIVFGGPGHYVAEVKRGFEIGFAVGFCQPIADEEFSAALRLYDE